MKKFLQRFFGIAVSAALVVSSGVTTVFAHNHRTSDKEIPLSDAPKYTITLTKPEGVEINNGAYGAYQIFTGTVKGNAPTNPGNTVTGLPITDIKWGNAFGDVNSEEWKQNIVGFVIALANPFLGPDNKY